MANEHIEAMVQGWLLGLDGRTKFEDLRPAGKAIYCTKSRAALLALARSVREKGLPYDEQLPAAHLVHRIAIVSAALEAIAKEGRPDDH